MMMRRPLRQGHFHFFLISAAAIAINRVVSLHHSNTTKTDTQLFYCFDRGKMKLLLVLVVIATAAVTVNGQQPNTSNTEQPRFLALPDPVKCSRRPKEFFFDGHWYFFSGNITRFRGQEVDWLEARNNCREYCMDTVSIEGQEENDIMLGLLRDHNLKYIWTSGRLCDFKGCAERSDLQPVHVNGWFWSGSGTKMAPTNQKPKGWDYQPWSHTGNNKRPQPDNAEVEINGTPESCMAVLNNVYKDGLNWHDVACYHPKPFVCEDSDELLKYVRATRPELPV